jgi:hypothetical protein
MNVRLKVKRTKFAVFLLARGQNPKAPSSPPGVCHGYKILADATVMYLVDVEYTGKDEYGVRWNDPALGLPADWYGGPSPQSPVAMPRRRCLRMLPNNDPCATCSLSNCLDNLDRRIR